MGDVDRGDTTMDYMREERERGITIQSACITMHWNRSYELPASINRSLSPSSSPISSTSPPSSSINYRVNLIDTPGHVDFTQQVEQSLRVLDGAIVILDGVKGVEAQTRTVWRQAERYNVNRIIFVNKMDRIGASMQQTVMSIQNKLNTIPLVIQTPLYYDGSAYSLHPESGVLCGVVNLLDCQAALYADAFNEENVTMQNAQDVHAHYSIHSIFSPTFPHGSLSSHLSTLLHHRQSLIEQLVDIDEIFAEEYLTLEQQEPGLLAISPTSMRAALRRITLSHPKSSSSSSSSSSYHKDPSYTIVLCGSSKMNRGVQPLLDAIVDYLPSPLDKPLLPLHLLSMRPNAQIQQSLRTIAQHKGGSPAPGMPIMLHDMNSVHAPLTALAFKVSHDLNRGCLPIVFVRVYAGIWKKGEQIVSVQPVYGEERGESNVGRRGGNENAAASTSAVSLPATSTSFDFTKLPSERPQKLVEISADSMTHELQNIEAGNIGAAMGLKYTRTGDTLLHPNHTNLLPPSKSSSQDKTISNRIKETIGVMQGIHVGEPVFACSIEANSHAAQVRSSPFPSFGPLPPASSHYIFSISLYHCICICYIGPYRSSIAMPGKGRSEL